MVLISFVRITCLAVVVKSITLGSEVTEQSLIVAKVTRCAQVEEPSIAGFKFL